MAKKKAADTAAAVMPKGPAIEIRPVEYGWLQLDLVGKPPGAAMNRFRESSIRAMEEANMGMQIGKKRRDPVSEFLESIHLLDPQAEYDLEKIMAGKLKFGYPASAFKKCFVQASRFWKVHGLPSSLMVALFVDADTPEGLVELEAPPPQMLRQTVQSGWGSNVRTAVTYRALFPTWKARVTIRYIKTQILRDAVVQLVADAGEMVGIGSWRVERQGVHGRFEVAAVHSITGAGRSTAHKPSRGGPMRKAGAVRIPDYLLKHHLDLKAGRISQELPKKSAKSKAEPAEKKAPGRKKKAAEPALAEA